MVPSRSALAIPALICLLAACSAQAQEQPLVIRWLDVDVRGSVAYFGRTAGLVALDFSDLEKPRELGQLSLSATVYGVEFMDRLAVLSVGTHGLFVVDLEDPAQPEVISRFDTPGSVLQARMHGGYALVADRGQGLRVIDLSDPKRPRQSAHTSSRGEVRSLAIDGDRLATAEGLGGVRLFDITRPDNPRPIGLLSGADGATDVAFVGDLLVVAAGSRGLLVYAPDSTGSYEQTATLRWKKQAAAVVGHEGKALVSCGSGGLKVVDLTEPHQPAVVAELLLPRSYPVDRVRVHDGLAFVSAGVRGFALVDLADPTQPQAIFPHDRPLRVTFE